MVYAQGYLSKWRAPDLSRRDNPPMPQAEIARPVTDEGVLDSIDWDKVTWETVVEESGEPVVFETVGDKFIGMYTGKRHVETEDGKFVILTFKGPGGRAYQTNAGWKLESAFDEDLIMRGDIVCVTYVKDVDTGQPSPMKDFRVQRAIRPAS